MGGISRYYGIKRHVGAILNFVCGAMYFVFSLFLNVKKNTGDVQPLPCLPKPSQLSPPSQKVIIAAVVENYCYA